MGWQEGGGEPRGRRVVRERERGPSVALSGLVWAVRPTPMLGGPETRTRPYLGLGSSDLSSQGSAHSGFRKTSGRVLVEAYARMRGKGV